MTDNFRAPANGPLIAAILRDSLEDQMRGIRDDVQAMRDDIGTVRDDVGALRCSFEQQHAIRMNKLCFSTGYYRLVEVPSDVHPPRANVEHLGPLHTVQDFLDLDTPALHCWLRFYNLFDSVEHEPDNLKKHFLFTFLGGSQFNLQFRAAL